VQFFYNFFFPTWWLKNMLKSNWIISRFGVKFSQTSLSCHRRLGPSPNLFRVSTCTYLQQISEKNPPRKVRPFVPIVFCAWAFRAFFSRQSNQRPISATSILMATHGQGAGGEVPGAVQTNKPHPRHEEKTAGYFPCNTGVV